MEFIARSQSAGSAAPCVPVSAHEYQRDGKFSSPCSLPKRWCVSRNRMLPELDLITILLPGLTPVKLTYTSFPEQRSSVVKTRFRSIPFRMARSSSSGVRATSRAWIGQEPVSVSRHSEHGALDSWGTWISPSRHFSAHALMTPSGLPPIPIITSASDDGIAAAMDISTSPSWAQFATDNGSGDT
eukprot:scaffold56_cov379-Prasinococcus_capsulatus_cf.AAC.2